jgi:type IV pilus assembly protein PilY1
MDIDNSSNSASALSIQGGRIADLSVDSSVNDARRFYYPPDAALIVQEGQAPFISIVAASGYRAHPLNTDIHDRMYMIRDYDVFTTPSTFTTITEADLFDTTDNIIGEGTQAEKITATTSLSAESGWFISLEELDGTFVGEKGLSEPLILNGVAIITTFTPASAGISTSACEANDGTGAIFFVNVADGTPTYDLSGNLDKTREDRKVFLDRGGIPPSPTVIITGAGTPTLCVGTECEQAGAVGAIQKMYWYEK